MKYFLNRNEITRDSNFQAFLSLEIGRVLLQAGDMIRADGEPDYTVQRRGWYQHCPHLIAKWRFLFEEPLGHLGCEEG